MAPPTTLREKLETDRVRLYEMRDALYNAILALMSGEAVVSYSVLNRSVTRSRADLGAMRAALKDLDRQIDEIEAMLSGRPARAVTTYSYLQPSIVLPDFGRRP